MKSANILFQKEIHKTAIKIINLLTRRVNYDKNWNCNRRKQILEKLLVNSKFTKIVWNHKYKMPNYSEKKKKKKNVWYRFSEMTEYIFIFNAKKFSIFLSV